MVEAELRIPDLAHALDAHGLSDEALAPISLGVLFAGEPAEEVSGTVVEFVRNDVMDDADVSQAGFEADKQRSVAVERESHEMMAKFTTEVAHDRIATTDFLTSGISSTSLLCRTKIVIDFLSFCVKKIALWMTPEDFAANDSRRHLFASLA